MLSAIIFGYIHINFALTPLAFFIYASGGLILALLYRMTKTSTINTSSYSHQYHCFLGCLVTPIFRKLAY